MNVPAAKPPNPWLARPAAIEQIAPEIGGVATYRLRLADAAGGDAYRFQPGQFNMLYVPGCGEAAISLSGDPAQHGAGLLHTIRVVGRVTEAIAAIRVGGQIGVRGPYGSSWPIDECRGRDVVLVAGGIGRAPLRPVVYVLAARRQEFRRVTLLYGARTPDMLLYAHEFAAWRGRGIDVQATVDRAASGWSGPVGAVPLLIDRLLPLDPAATVLFTCGPEVMMDFAIRSARQRGLARERIWLSMERNMQCAVGLCGHCQLGPAFVCRQGPVFRYDAIEPYLPVRDL
jgi:NAD(P)H-flavin reductase